MTVSENYPLQSEWTLYIDSGKNWPEGLKEVYHIKSLADFWSVYNNIPPVMQLPNGFSYHLFRNNIKPEWEDSNNIGGGRWFLLLPNPMCDDAWMKTCLMLLGAQHFNSHVTGASVQIKKTGKRLALWTQKLPDDEQRELGRSLKFGLQSQQSMTFVPHSRSDDFTLTI